MSASAPVAPPRASARTAILTGVGLLLWTAALRIPTFWRSVIDRDESLYMLVAREWLRGNLPGTVVWDHKPPGIHALFAVGLAVFGEPVLAMRLLSVLFVALGGLAIHQISFRFTRSRPASLLAAGLFAPFSLGLGGTAANTELFFTAFELLGLWVLAPLLHDPEPRRTELVRLAGAGLLFGCALQIKYLAVFEVSWFALAALVALHRSPRDWRRVAAAAGLLAAGGALPSLAAVATYWFQGQLPLFLYANFGANRVYAGLVPFRLAAPYGLRATLDWLLWVSPLLLPAGLLLLRGGGGRRKADTAVLVFLAGYLLATFAAAWATLRFYPHYFLPTLPACCFLIGFAAARAGRPGKSATAVSAVLLAGLSLFPLARVVESSYRHWWGERRATGADSMVTIAAYLRERLGPGERIYVVNDEPVLYLLAESEVPTRYALPTLLTSSAFSRVAGVDVDREVRRILASRPAFVVVGDDLAGENTRRILSILMPHYEPDRVFGRVAVYRSRARNPRIGGRASPSGPR